MAGEAAAVTKPMDKSEQSPCVLAGCPVIGKVDVLLQSMTRLENRIEKDSEDLFERVRKLEISIALAQQAHESWRSQSKRDLALVAAIVGTGGGAIASGVARLLGG